jgi:Tol biopolymer transport system component
LAEETLDREELVFTGFDSVKGRGTELTRLYINSNSDYIWDLSPNGTSVAIVNRSDGQIRILSLNARAPQEIHPKGWNTAQSLNWAADGKALLISSRVQGRLALLHVDLQGNTRVLWHPGGGAAEETVGVPSRDGRHLAILGWSENGNIWMMENF